MRIHRRLLLSAPALALLPRRALAQTALGTMRSLTGQGVLTRAGQALPLHPDDPLQEGDMVATRGWVDGSDKEVLPFAHFLLSIGVNTIVYTDISRDGMLTGPNFEMLSLLQQLPIIRLIASGGVSGIDDLKQLQAMKVYGAITGKALYEGKVTMAQIRALGGM